MGLQLFKKPPAYGHKMVAHPLAAAVIGVVGVLHDEVFVVGQRVALHHVARAAPPLRFSSPSAVSKRRLFSHFEVHHQKELETNCYHFIFPAVIRDEPPFPLG